MQLLSTLATLSLAASISANPLPTVLFSRNNMPSSETESLNGLTYAYRPICNKLAESKTFESDCISAITTLESSLTANNYLPVPQALEWGSCAIDINFFGHKMEVDAESLLIALEHLVQPGPCMIEMVEGVFPGIAVTKEIERKTEL